MRLAAAERSGPRKMDEKREKSMKNGIIGKVPVRKPPEKPRFPACLARGSARMGPPEPVGAELRAGKGCCRFGHQLSPGPFGTALNGISKATKMQG